MDPTIARRVAHLVERRLGADTVMLAITVYSRYKGLTGIVLSRTPRVYAVDRWAFVYTDGRPIPDGMLYSGFYVEDLNEALENYSQRGAGAV